MPVSVQCPNPDCHASFNIALGDAPRFRRCPQCGWDLLAGDDSDPVATFSPEPNPVRALGNEQPPQSAPDPLVGEAIAGRYTILEVLGRGGMGAVYLASDARLGGRKVAVKVPTLVDVQDAAFLKRLEREAHIAAQFQHPNICPIFDFGTHNGRPFLVLAYIKGTSLAARLDRRSKPLDVVQAVKLVQVVAQAMHQAHETGIIHRDLKPDNIMLTREGRPIVMDFGLSKRADSSEKLTSAGKAFGTPAYMPLEQFQDVGAIDHRADIYSLGVTLYQLLTGRLPYRGTVYQIMGALVKANPAASPSELRSDVDPELAAICLKAMAREAADRYGSMSEFAEALRLWLKRTTGRESAGVHQDTSPVGAGPSRVGPSGSPAREARGPSGRREGRGAAKRGLVALGVSGLMVLLAIVADRANVWGTVPIVPPPAKVDMPKSELPLAPPVPKLQTAEQPPAPSPAEATASTPAPSVLPPRWTSGSTGMTFALIPAGEFIMGSTDGADDEKPPHPVKISKSFYMGVHEVTQGEYKEVMGKNPSWYEFTDRHPVENVSWKDAIAFCNKISNRDGLTPYYRSEEGEAHEGDGYRLPTEAEWEYACRAGSTTNYSFGDDESRLKDFAWYAENSPKRTTNPVDQKAPNAFGLFDMHGNVWEWCWDGYSPNFYERSPVNDPVCPGQRATLRVVRGGGWNGIARLTRSAHRNGFTPLHRSGSLGFRLVRAQSEPR
jgi:formylglycine-generating enzyme required for sulfatase activity